MADNKKYEITDIAHPEYPFLHRIRALKSIHGVVRAGALGGYVEHEGNLSIDDEDSAWIADDAIACNNAYVDKGAQLRGKAVACGNAYISGNAVLHQRARAEDNAFIRGASVGDDALVSGNGMILCNPENGGIPILVGRSKVYGEVFGAVWMQMDALVFSGEVIRNDTPEVLILNGNERIILRNSERNQLKPNQNQERAQQKEPEIYR